MKETTIKIEFNTTGRTKEEIKALKKIIAEHVRNFAIIFSDVDRKYLDNLVELLMMYINAPIRQRKLQRKEHKDTVKKTTSEIAHKIHFMLFKVFDEVDKTVPKNRTVNDVMSGTEANHYLQEFVNKILKITGGDNDVVKEALKVVASYYAGNEEERVAVRAKADESLKIATAAGKNKVPELHKITLEMFDLIDSGKPLSKYFNVKKETADKLMEISQSMKVVKSVLGLLDGYMTITSKKERDSIKKDFQKGDEDFSEDENKCKEIALKAMETMDEIDFGNPKGKAN